LETNGKTIMSKTTSYFLWALQVITAIIRHQTLYFKFSAQPESVYIFSKLGVEPWGRIGSGVVELFAGIFLLIPRTAWLGALMAAGVMVGAIFSHLTVLGIEVQGDHGELFILALIVFTCSLTILFMRKKEIPVVKNYFPA
jgi:uncharacterized membrane protein YphA (DoxX/SURF4 family)